MAYGDRARCKSCGREIIQIGGGHRQRQYCDDTCKQRAYQERREQAHMAALRALWVGYLPTTQEMLVGLTRQYSEEFARRFAAVIDAEKQQSSSLATGDVSLVRLGERLSYPELHVKHPGGGHAVVLRAGKANWLHFADVAEKRTGCTLPMWQKGVLSGRWSMPPGPYYEGKKAYHDQRRRTLSRALRKAGSP